MENNISVRKQDNTGIITCRGAIDSDTYRTFKDSLGNLIESGIYKIVIVLSDISFMNSTGWGTIIGNLRNVRQKKGDIVLAAMNENLKTTYYRTNFDEIIKAYDTIEDALSSFSSEIPEQRDR